MKPAWLAVLPMLAAAAACTPIIPQSAPQSPSASAEWEAVAIPGSRTVSDDIIKINTGTGASWLHCCGSNNTNFVTIRDSAPPAAGGDYHLVAWSQVAPNGDVNWNIYRFDRKSGRTWVIETVNGAYLWSDINTTVP